MLSFLHLFDQRMLCWLSSSGRFSVVQQAFGTYWHIICYKTSHHNSQMIPILLTFSFLCAPSLLFLPFKICYNTACLVSFLPPDFAYCLPVNFSKFAIFSGSLSLLKSLSIEFRFRFLNPALNNLLIWYSQFAFLIFYPASLLPKSLLTFPKFALQFSISHSVHVLLLVEIYFSNPIHLVIVYLLSLFLESQSSLKEQRNEHLLSLCVKDFALHQKLFLLSTYKHSIKENGTFYCFLERQSQPWQYQGCKA